LTCGLLRSNLPLAIVFRPLRWCCAWSGLLAGRPWKLRAGH